MPRRAVSPRAITIAVVAAMAAVFVAIPIGVSVFRDDHGRRPDYVLEQPEPLSIGFSSVEWSSDGSRLYLVGAGGIDVLSGSPLEVTDRIEFERPNQLATWTADRSMVALWSTDPGVELWDVESGDELPALDVGGERAAPAWSPDGALIAVAGGNGQVVIFDPRIGDEVEQFDVFERGIQVLAMAWPQADRIIAASFNSVTAIDPGTGEVVWSHVGNPDDMVVGSPAAGAVVDGEGRVFTLDDGTELGHVSVVSYVKALDWSPDGAWLMASGDDDRPQLWEAESARTQNEYPSLQPFGAGVSWSPDSRRVAIPDLYDRRIVIVDVTTDADGDELSIAEDVVLSDSAWSPAGDRLAAIGDGHIVFVWDVAG